MFTFPHRLFQFDLNRLLSRSLLVSTLSIVSLLSGLTPTLQPRSPFSFGNPAYAQVISNTELQNYARSLLAIEPLRQAAYDQIKRTIGSGEVPAIACHRPSSLSRLAQTIRQIAVSYCNQAIDIVERHNLTISRFNTITTNLQTDPSLSLLIQQELIRLQQPSP